MLWLLQNDIEATLYDSLQETVVFHVYPNKLIKMNNNQIVLNLSQNLDISLCQVCGALFWPFS